MEHAATVPPEALRAVFATRLLDEAKLSYRVMSKATGIAPSTLWHRLNDRPNFTAEELVQLAALVGRPLSELVAEAEGSAA